jgi:two-component system OmpR family sensor kinase
MKLHSLYTKIKLIFLVLFLLLTALFLVAFFISKGHDMMETHKRYMGVSKMILKQHRHGGGMPHTWVLENNHLVLIEEKRFQEEVIQNAQEMRRDKMAPPKPYFTPLRYEDRHFVFIKRKDLKVLLEDTNFPKPPYYLLFWYLLAMGMVVLFYFWMTKSLKPLKELQQEIQKVAEGDLTISLRREEKDEIAQVANEFDNALRKIEALMTSRQLFMRTIMHELKTPIAKGRIVTEMLDERAFQRKYETVFERLELLIEEFSKIEQMLSSSYELKQRHYNIYDILDQAIELMILDDFEEVIEIEEQGSFALYTDFNLLALALKNLLDNALKYRSEGKVHVLIEENAISIINHGEPLSKEIEHFFQPFHQETNPLNGGLGLGLYIVKSIVERLALDLTYEYVENHHHFKISQKH